VLLFRDFPARRANILFRPQCGGQARARPTLTARARASAVMIAVLENFQNADAASRFLEGHCTLNFVGETKIARR